jgi:hypothetical protein
MHQVFLYFKTAYDSAGIEVMCKILIEIKDPRKVLKYIRHPVVIVLLNTFIMQYTGRCFIWVYKELSEPLGILNNEKLHYLSRSHYIITKMKYRTV